MDVLTLYSDQGSLVGIRTGNEGIIVDAHMPECDHVTPGEIQQSLSVYFKGVTIRGLILTGFDADHAHTIGVEWLLWQFVPDWIMYPKCFKNTDNATSVFRSIDNHEKRRVSTNRPLIRHSVRLDMMDSREIKGLGQHFTLELFSPHIEDMDSSNNCSIVAKITGTGSRGFRYLATGDTETNRWETISKLVGTHLAADVMAAAHHGALSGMHAKTLLNISPNTVLISAGVESQYDHPHGAAVRAYQAVAQHVWSTNAGGMANNLLTRREGSDFNTTVFAHAPVPA
jgi:beta-lactamase superfamily II metal-dependent hydrolase